MKPFIDTLGTTNVTVAVCGNISDNHQRNVVNAIILVITEVDWPKKHISERPLSAENKRFFDHWEIDTVFGKVSKDCIVTLVERKSKYVLIGKLTNKSTKELNQRTLKLMLQQASKFKTITADNGTEFYQYQCNHIAKQLNQRPRKCLQYRTPEEIFNDH